MGIGGHYSVMGGALIIGMTPITSTLCLLTCVARMLCVLTYQTISVVGTLLIFPLTEEKAEAPKVWVTLPGSGSAGLSTQRVFLQNLCLYYYTGSG